MKSLPDIAKWKMNASLLSATEPHPDFGVLTAFVEGSLAQQRRNDVLVHLANCAHCNDVVSLAAPVMEEALVPSKAKSGWNIWNLLPMPRFAVPALVAAMVLIAVGTFRPHPVLSPTVAISNPSPSTTVATAPPVSATPAVSAPGKAVVPTSNLPVVARASQPKPKAATAPEEPALGPLSRDAANVTMQTTPLPSTSLAVPAHTVEVPLTSRVAAPAAGPCWKVSDAGKLQKSMTCGEAWTDISFDSPVFIRVIQSAANNIWVGGNAGALYHSADGGIHWNRVNVTNLTDDIVAIAFGSPMHGRLATVDGKTWATYDGGLTWNRQ